MRAAVALAEYGYSFSDSRIICAEYTHEHVRELVRGLSRLEKAKRLIAQAEMMEVLNIHECSKHNKTAGKARAWHQRVKTQLEDLLSNKPEPTVWEKLRMPVGRVKTLFERMKE